MLLLVSQHSADQRFYASLCPVQYAVAVETLDMRVEAAPFGISSFYSV